MYTIKEIAQKYRVRDNTVYRWIYTQGLQCVKIGRVIRVTEEQLTEFKARKRK